MEIIKCKFKFKQKVWLIHENQVTEGEIKFIDATVDFNETLKSTETIVKYNILPNGYEFSQIKNIIESRLFPTKEALIASLLLQDL